LEDVLYCDSTSDADLMFLIARPLAELLKDLKVDTTFGSSKIDMSLAPEKSLRPSFFRRQVANDLRFGFFEGQLKRDVQLFDLPFQLGHVFVELDLLSFDVVFELDLVSFDISFELNLGCSDGLIGLYPSFLLVTLNHSGQRVR
jgi:hypothetical protein